MIFDNINECMSFIAILSNTLYRGVFCLCPNIWSQLGGSTRKIDGLKIPIYQRYSNKRYKTILL
jgi:hypothetical protein